MRDKILGERDSEVSVEVVWTWLFNGARLTDPKDVGWVDGMQSFQRYNWPCDVVKERVFVVGCHANATTLNAVYLFVRLGKKGCTS